MAAKGKSSKHRKNGTPIEPVSAHEKIARLLALVATKDIEQIGERVALLRAVGFGVAEVASILGMTEGHVRVAAHHGRKKRGKRAMRPRKQ